MIPSLFVCIPKTASQSMSQALSTYGLQSVRLGDNKRGEDFDPTRTLTTFQHAGPESLVDSGLITQDWLDKRWRFAFIRNPWDRMVSLYFYLFKRLGRHRERFGNLSFAEFVDLVTANQIEPVGAYNWKGLSQARPQVDWIPPPFMCGDYQYTWSRTMQAGNFIGKFEHIDGAWKELCRILGIDADLQVTNTTDHRPYQEYYTTALRDAVATYYRKDVELGQYEFNE